MTGGANPVRHVIIALSITAVLFLIAGESWSHNVGRLQPVHPVAKV